VPYQHSSSTNGGEEQCGSIGNYAFRPAGGFLAMLAGQDETDASAESNL